MRLEVCLTLALLLAGLAPAVADQSGPMEATGEVAPRPGILWKPGTLIQNQYKELAGTLVLDGPQLPVVRSEGHDYVLMMGTQEAVPPLFKNKAAVIMKGIAAIVALPDRPVQYLYWPMECTIKMKRYEFPDPSADHGRWMETLVGNGFENHP